MAEAETKTLSPKSFDTEKELKEIVSFSDDERKNLDSNERRNIKKERLAHYRENLSERKEKIAELNAELEKMVLGKGSVDWQGARNHIADQAKALNLSEADVKKYLLVLDKVKAKSEVISSFEKKYKGKDEKFFEDLYGVKPVGKIKVLRRSLSFSIRCEDQRDFTIMMCSRPKGESVTNEFNDRLIELSKIFEGTVPVGCQIKELDKLVVGHDLSKLGKYVDPQGALEYNEIHEEKHIIDRLVEQKVLTSGMLKGKEKREQVEGVIKVEIEPFYYSSKTEIFAYLKSGNELEQIRTFLSEGGSYDNFKFVKFEIKPEELGITEKQIDSIVERLKSEHAQYVKKALNIVEDLSQKGYSREKIIGLFQTEDIREWGKVYERVINHNGKNSKEKKMDPSRDPALAGTEHIIYKLKKSKDKIFADLVPEDKMTVTRDTKGNVVRMDIDYDPDKATPEEKEKFRQSMDKKLKEMSLKLFDILVTHGYAKERDNGEYEMTKNYSDLDGEACLSLMQLAGIDTSIVKYVPQGMKGKSREKPEDGIIMDTGEMDGIVSEEGGRRIVIDHHGKESDRATSATKYVYRFLLGNGLLEKKKHLDEFVEFITQHDNYYPNLTEEQFRKSYQTLRGLAIYMDPKDILELFEGAEESGVLFDPDKPFTQKFLQDYIIKTPDKKNRTLEIVGNEMKMFYIDNSFKNIEKLDDNGFVFDTGEKNFGKILIDTSVKKGDKYYPKVQAGYDAARFRGYGGYLRWSPQTDSFVLYTDKNLKEIGLSQGFNMRGHMWMKPHNKEKLEITLQEIFSKLSGKKVTIPDKLRKSLAQDKLDKTLVDAPEDVLKELDKEKEIGGNKSMEKEFPPERMKVMGFAIKNITKRAGELKEFIESGKVIKLTGTEEEIEKNLRERIDKHIEKSLREYSVNFYKLENEEIEHIKEKCMGSIFKNK